MGGQINTATGKWPSNAARCKAQRAARKQTDPDFLARERQRVAALRGQRTPAQVAEDRAKAQARMRALRGTPPAQTPPAAPGASEPSPVAEQTAPAPLTIVARVTAELDAIYARRVRERELRRAERRRSA